MFYLKLFRALSRQKVRYLLVGGVAVNLHGAERMKVEDVSISVAAAEDLIALKSGTGRKIDESDILALRRLKRLRGRKRGRRIS